MVRECRICGEEFDSGRDKPGYANECMACTEESKSLRVKSEVRGAHQREAEKGNHQLRDGLPKGLAVRWGVREKR